MNYPPSKTLPWSHQKTAWDLSFPHEGYYFALDMGCGKSKCAIDFCAGVNAQRVLLVCPKSVIPEWKKQFRVHSAINYEVYAENPNNKISVEKKAEKIKSIMVRCTMTRKPFVIVINYESFWRPPLGPTYNDKKRITNKGLFGLCRPLDVFILDEAHRIKAPGGQASRRASVISKNAKRRLLLSGTPMPHSPMDIYAQYRTMDSGIFGWSFTNFRAKYAVMGGYGGHEIRGYQNQDEFNQKMYSRMYRVTKDEVLDLPDVMHETRTCYLDPKLTKIYRTMDKEFVAALDDGELTAANALVKILRLAQLTGGCVKNDDGKEIILGDEKIDTLKELVEDLAEDEPLVIFCRFTNEIRRIREMLTKLNRTNGELSGQENQMVAWQNGEFNTLVVQIRSGGVGVDLTRTRYCIYFSIGHSLGDYEQSLSRPHRPGQKRNVTYYHIVAENTIDETIYEALSNKKEVIDLIYEKNPHRKDQNEN